MSSLGDTKNHFSGKTVDLEIFCCCSAAFSLQLDYVYVFCPLKTLCLTRYKKYGVKKHFQEEMYFFVTASLIFHYLIKVEFCTILQNSKTLMILATIYSMHLHFYVIYKLVLKLFHWPCDFSMTQKIAMHCFGCFHLLNVILYFQLAILTFDMTFSNCHLIQFVMVSIVKWIISTKIRFSHTVCETIM